MKKTFFILFSILLIATSFRKSEGNLYFINTDNKISDEKLNANSSFIALYKKLLKNADTINIDNIKYYVVEGDVLMSELEFKAYINHNIYDNSIKLSKNMFSKFDINGVAEYKDGKVVKWENGTVLNYSICKISFKDTNNYKLVRDSMLKAVAEWNSIIPNKIKVVYDPSKDNMQLSEYPTSKSSFIIKEIDTAQLATAFSFFPNSFAERQFIYIVRKRFYKKDIIKTGVLRHEIGHIFGLRHEFARTDCSWQKCYSADDIYFKPKILSGCDKLSIMAYVCEDFGNPAYTISDNDKEGLKALYNY